MWTCPKCERTFKQTGQNHYCRALSSIDQYIADQPENYQARLHEVRRTIAEVVPDAVECIKWQMPTFYQKENIIHFAYNQNHLGIYPGEEAVRSFQDELEARGLAFSKGAIRLPWSQELPLDLIRRITLHRKQVLSL